MTTEEAKSWVEHFYEMRDTWPGEKMYEQADELFEHVVHLLYGCFDATSPNVRENVKGAGTYHDVWLELVTDEILDSGNLYGHVRELDALHDVYGKDQHARQVAPTSREGFRAWLGVWLPVSDIEGILQSWPPQGTEHVTQA